jgi:hypothetical protein
LIADKIQQNIFLELSKKKQSKIKYNASLTSPASVANITDREGRKEEISTLSQTSGKVVDKSYEGIGHKNLSLINNSQLKSRRNKMDLYPSKKKSGDIIQASKLGYKSKNYGLSLVTSIGNKKMSVDIDKNYISNKEKEEVLERISDEQNSGDDLKYYED